MDELIKSLLLLSLFGTLLVLLLSLLKPLYRERFSKRWQYYIWLAAALRLVLPFSLDAALFSSLFDRLDMVLSSDSAKIAAISVNITASAEAAPAEPMFPQPPIAAFQNTEKDTWSIAPITNNQSNPDTAPTPYIEEHPRISDESPAKNTLLRPLPFPVLPYLGIGLSCTWLAVALFSLLRKILVYRRFSHFLKVACNPVTDRAILDLLAECSKQQQIRTTIALYTSPLVASPLLTGFFRPAIVLPNSAVHDTIASMPDISRNPESAPGEKLVYIFTHELIHYKRRDMFCKWFVQIVCCIHWFNPFLRLLAKEAGRACELACDETVTAKLDNKGKIAYGNTLLSFLRSEQDYSNALISMTLTEGARELKERLSAIVKTKKKTKWQTLLTILTTAVLSLCAAAPGVYAQTARPVPPGNTDCTPDKGTCNTTDSAPGEQDTAFCSAPSQTEIGNPPAEAASPDEYEKFWEKRLVETYSVIIKRQHRCTICGAPVNLYKKVERYVYCNTKTEKKRGDPNPPGPSGAAFSNHPCYMDAKTRAERNDPYYYWIR